MRGCLVPVILLLCTWMVLSAPREPYFIDVDDPEAVMEVLSRLGRSLLRRRDIEQSKRGGVDFGLGRGFSGTQAAKHLMGLAAANYAIGPGRKRRQIELD